MHYAHTEGSVRPYRVGNHQHTPEIELVLDRAAGVATSVTFVPHLVPAVRGVLVTCYGRLTGNHGLTRTSPLERHYRNVLCSRVHTPQDDVIISAAGLAALSRKGG